MSTRLNLTVKKTAAGLVFLGAITAAVLTLWDVFERGVEITQDDPSCNAEIAKFVAREHTINTYYQREFRKFPFSTELPDFQQLEQLVGQIDTCPEISKVYPVASANALSLLGVRWLIDNNIHPKNSLAQAIPLFERSYKISRNEFMGKAIVDLKESLLPENNIDGGMDGAPFLYYTFALTSGADVSSLAEFRAKIKNVVAPRIPASTSLSTSVEQQAERWLYQKATLSSIEDALHHKEQEYFVRTGDRRHFKKTSQKEDTGLFRIEALLGSYSFSWLVDLQTLRYQSLNDETAKFMLSDVLAMASTFSKNFNVSGSNTPLRYSHESMPPYTNAVSSWFLDEGGPQGVEGYLAALFGKIESGGSLSDNVIGKKVDINMNLKWVDQRILELSSTVEGDIGSGNKVHNYVWHVYHLEGRYEPVSSDAQIYELLIKIYK